MNKDAEARESRTCLRCRTTVVTSRAGGGRRLGLGGRPQQHYEGLAGPRKEVGFPLKRFKGWGCVCDMI